MDENLLNVLLLVHPSAPYFDRTGASGLTFFKRMKYRRNVKNLLKRARDRDFLVIHFCDIKQYEPELKKRFGTKSDLEVATKFASGEPYCLPLREDKKFNVYVAGAFAGACVRTAVEYFSKHLNSLYLVLDCIVPKYDNLLANEYRGKVKLECFREFNAKEILSNEI